MHLSGEFRRYKSYVQTGLEWLPEIPSHWEISRIKHISKIIMGQSPKSEDYTLEPIGRPFLQGNAEFGETHPHPTKYCDTAVKFSIPGDFLLSVRAPVGALNISDQEYGIGRGLCALRCNPEKLFRKYFFYLLKYFSQELTKVSVGSTYDAVAVEDVGTLLCVVPSFAEQQAIADFLDRETARIDALIDRYQRLIALLEEQRTALISQTVTRGLDPTVKMKDSGVEWLGEIPAHWEVIPFLFAFDVVYRYPTYYEIPYVDNGVIEVRGEAIGTDMKIHKLDDERYISEETSRKFYRTILSEGDIVMSVRGTMGKIGLVDERTKGANITANLLRLSPKRSLISPNYLGWFLTSQAFREILNLHSSQTTIKTITIPQLSKLKVVLPPIIEQIGIEEDIRMESKRFDGLIGNAILCITKLQEYRSALISSAVTGKIDVR